VDKIQYVLFLEPIKFVLSALRMLAGPSKQHANCENCCSKNLQVTLSDHSRGTVKFLRFCRDLRDSTWATLL